jgi:hypothetical protein
MFMEYMGIAALVVALITVIIWFRKAWKVDPPDTPRVFQGFWFLSLLLGLTSLNASTGSIGAWAVDISALLLMLTFTGSQKVGSEGIDVGDTIPSFTAFSDDKKLFTSSDLAGSRVLIKFFRAHCDLIVSPSYGDGKS